MLGPNCSDFGWNETNKCVTAEEHIFDEWVKSHLRAKELRNKSFPHFNDLGGVFGKDRANGEGAEAPADVVEELESDVWLCDDVMSSNVTVTQDATSKEFNKPSGSRNRARSNDDWLGQLSETMCKVGEMYQSSTDNLAKNATCYQTEAKRITRRMTLFDELLKVEGLTDLKRLQSGEIIVSGSHKIDFFFALPLLFKKQYVLKVLNYAT